MCSLADLEQQPELIDRYVTRKIQAGYSPKTVINHLLCLQVMLKRAVRWKLIRTNPVSECERPRVRESELNVLSEVEIARLWNAYGELEREATVEEQVWWRIARTITFFGLGTAMRRGELLALRWKDVRLLEGQVRYERRSSRAASPRPSRAPRAG